MARPKKDAAAAAAAPSTGTIPVSEFQRTRDSVVTGLVTLQKSINELMTAYVSHCDTIVGGGTSNSLGISNFLNNISSEPVVLETKQRRKRAKKEKDPNAPKRPLTAYFLYSHHARDIIKNDLKNANDGTEPKSQEVQDEATKRWNNMEAGEKKGWTDAYTDNYEKYKVEMAKYLDKKKAEALAAGVPEDEAVAAAHVDTESENEVPAKLPTPPVKAPATKAAAAKKPRKNAKAAANGVSASPAPLAPKTVATPIPLPSDAAKGAEKPDSKKRKKAPAKEKETPAKAAAEEEPKKKKPRKSKAAEEPAAEPEKKKRKRKSEAAS